jgi:hypothetical protein
MNRVENSEGWFSEWELTGNVESDTKDFKK